MVNFVTYGAEQLDRKKYVTVILPLGALYDSLEGTRIHLCGECLQGHKEATAKRKAAEEKKLREKKFEQRTMTRATLASDIADALLEGDIDDALRMARKVAAIDAEERAEYESD
ncbi:hypothetical protein [Corynebacterium sp. HS2168-gen11]|uniref:hypothetical protein n=1 Tax=Corynebacterium sp. HS2168-gen11 TaxID=2974027 RepID=UPI00216AF55B|nr:hypothetical protein [Corynebacterium sp. HS2168-gen11]MCS4535420.1 hypothetical protein [Corynebacterium sp. HS2168-gen11]